MLACEEPVLIPKLFIEPLPLHSRRDTLTQFIMKPPRVRQKDIAAKAGVSRSAVSMALTNHPRIPKATRDRILETAKQLGYQPDPMLTALAVYRSAKRPATFHGTLAWLFSSKNSFDWKRSIHFSDYFEGAAAQARRHGYQLENFDANEEYQTTRRLASILWARNISGILLCPQPSPRSILNLPFDNLSTVTFGYSLEKPHLHTITAAHYLATQEVVKRLTALGCQRIGLCFPQVSLERSNFNYLAGYLINQNLNDPASFVPPFTQHPKNLDNFAEWIKKHCLQAIIAEDERIVADLAAIGLKVPRDISVASPCLPRPNSPMTGIVEDGPTIGAVAVDFLVSALQRGERGVPSSPQRIHVEGSWNRGQTVRRQKN